MLRRSALAALAAAISLLPLAGCDKFQGGSEIRYRISLVINTPQGPRTGSGVWSFKLRPGNIDQTYNGRFRGEAIPIDLPNGRTVFALLDLRAGNNDPIGSAQGSLPETALFRAFLAPSGYPASVGTSREKQLQYLKEYVRSRVQLNCVPTPYVSECPLLVTFKGPDPTSVTALDPDRLSDDLGPGYSLGGMFLQVTNDGPTRQLDGRLPWESQVGGNHLDGSGANRPGSLASRLIILSFKRWDS
jgi:hypothetical protein